MPAGAFTLYSKALTGIGDGLFNFGADTYIFALLTNSYVPAPNSDGTWANVSAFELATAGGYTAGGVVLTGVTYTQSGAVNTFTCTSPSWSLFSATLRYGVIVRRAGGSVASSDLLLCYSDLSGGGSITGGGSIFTVNINPAGAFTVAHTP